MRRMVMLRGLGLILGVALTGCATAASDPTPPARSASSSLAPVPVATMSELMAEFIFPASDAVFYIETRVPDSGEAWNELVGWTLMLAESANLLMAPERAVDSDQWMRDAELLRVAGAAAYEAAKARDVQALIGLSDALYESCTTCHSNYRPGYGRGG